MAKKFELRHIVTSVASIPVYKVYGKTEMYRQAAKDGWGTVYRDETNTLVCVEDGCADFYTKNGGYYGLSANDEVNTRELPKQPECTAIITGDAWAFYVWAEDFSQIRIFVTCDENGLIDTYRIAYGANGPLYDGETEISFEDLYEPDGPRWDHSYRADIPGTMEYQRKQETAAHSEQPAPTAAPSNRWWPTDSAGSVPPVPATCGRIVKPARDKPPSEGGGREAQAWKFRTPCAIGT